MQNDDPNAAESSGANSGRGPLNDLMQFLGSWSKAWVTAVSYQLVFVIGFLDVLTGYEISVSFFYLLPVSLGTWFAGPITGACVAAFSVLVWFAADLIGRPHYRYPLTPYWNAIIMALWFAVVVILLSTLRETVDKLQEMLRQRTERLRQEIEEHRRAEEQLKQSNPKS